MLDLATSEAAVNLSLVRSMRRRRRALLWCSAPSPITETTSTAAADASYFFATTRTAMPAPIASTTTTAEASADSVSTPHNPVSQAIPNAATPPAQREEPSSYSRVFVAVDDVAGELEHSAHRIRGPPAFAEASAGRPVAAARTGAHAEFVQNSRLGISAFFPTPASRAEGVLAKVRVEETTIPCAENAVGGLGTAPDPIGFSGGDANLYAYAANDPVNYADPTGHVVTLLAGEALDQGYEEYVAPLVEQAAYEYLGPTGAATALTAVAVVRAVGSPRKAVTSAIEGTYKIMMKNKDWYVGSAKNLFGRLKTQLFRNRGVVRRNGYSHADVDYVEIQEVTGGRTAREMYEQVQILDAGGVTDPHTLNKVNPVGGREDLMDAVEAWRR